MDCWLAGSLLQKGEVHPRADQEGGAGRGGAGGVQESPFVFQFLCRTYFVRKLLQSEHKLNL
jgi:hypothetical protein